MIKTKNPKVDTTNKGPKKESKLSTKKIVTVGKNKSVKTISIKKENDISNNNVSSSRHEKTILSDDTLDGLERDIGKFNDTKNLGEKLIIYEKLRTKIDLLMAEVNENIKYMDLIEHNNNNAPDISGLTDDSISNLMRDIEQSVSELEHEECIKDKINKYSATLHQISVCKRFYENKKINIHYCN